MRIYNKNKVYEEVMAKISHYVKHKLNEMKQIKSPYDTYEEDFYDSKPGRLTVDIRDILNGDVQDDAELDKLTNVVNKLGLTDFYYVYVVNGEITDDSDLQEALSLIQSDNIRNTIETYVYNQIEKDIANNKEEYDYDDADDIAYERYAAEQEERDQFRRHNMKF